MKTLRYVDKKHINENSRPFTEEDFRKAAIYANGKLSEYDTDRAIEHYNSGRPLRTFWRVSDKLTAGMNEWCEQNGFNSNDWTMFGDVNKVFFADGEDEDAPRAGRKLTEEISNAIDDDLRKECYNVAYNMVLSAQMEGMGREALIGVTRCFDDGFNGISFGPVTNTPNEAVFKEANRLGSVAKQLGNVRKFMDYIETEYGLV